MMNEVRTIKRYQNRKLYDTYQSCYVTLEEIAQIIREGHEIQVIDNKSKSDITYMTQIQLLFDQERKSLRPSDTALLKRVIRSQEGTLTGYIRNLESKLGISSEKENNAESSSTNGSSFSSEHQESPETSTTESNDEFRTEAPLSSSTNFSTGGAAAGPLN